MGALAAVGVVGAVLVTAFVALALAATPALAHARLLSTSPAGGATLEQPPPAVTLEFSERIEAAFGGVQVFDPTGARVDAGEARITDSQVQVPLAPLPQTGTYTVVFRIISTDGHPVESRFTFDFQPPPPDPTATPAAPVPTAVPTTAPTAEPPTSTPALTSPPPSVPADVDLEDAGPGSTAGLWVARLLNYLSLTAVAGLLLTAGWLLRAPGRWSPAQLRAARLAAGAAAAWVLSALLLYAFGLSNAAARPLPAAFSGDLPARFAATRFGGTVLAQAVVAAAIVPAALVARDGRRLAPAVALTALGAFAPAWWGHAGTADPPAPALLSDWLHVLAAALWVGGLAALAWLVLSPGRHGAAGEAGDAGLPASRFSGVATWAVGVVLVSGAVNAVLHLDALDQLWTTSWGRLVLTKLGLFAVIAWLGWHNRSRLLPRIARGGVTAQRALRSLALAEVGLMVVAFGAATALTSSVPADAEAAARVQSVVTAFDDGQINLTVDPATVGDNVVHLYFLGPDGGQREVEDVTVTLHGAGRSIALPLLVAGPGHYTVLDAPIEAAGTYSVAVRATTGGGPREITGQITIR